MKEFPVENIIVFGESSRPATEDGLRLIVANPTNTFHIARHFSRLPAVYEDSQIGQAYEYYDFASRAFISSIITRADIDAAYRTTGSKFFPDVRGLENPTKVIACIRSELRKRIARGKAHWIRTPFYQILKFTIKYPVPVGEQNVVPVTTLSNNHRASIKTVPRGSHGGNQSVLVQTVAKVSKLPTNNIAVEINLLPQKSYAFVTAYPGELSPNFPSAEQSAEEYRYNKDFWDTHVFIQ